MDLSENRNTTDQRKTTNSSNGDFPRESPSDQTASSASWGLERYNERAFLEEASDLLESIRGCTDREEARERLVAAVGRFEAVESDRGEGIAVEQRICIRDCARSLRSIFRSHAEQRAGFSVVQALVDLSNGKQRPDLSASFYAEMIHLFRGVRGRTDLGTTEDFRLDSELEGREAAGQRSENLDALWKMAQAKMAEYPHGLMDKVQSRRKARRREILEIFGGTDADWSNWQWQVRHVVKDVHTLEKAITLSPELRQSIKQAVENRLPFGVTPFYLSLMDREQGDDRALRAQVLPPPIYTSEMVSAKDSRDMAFDFMGEHDTSPVDLVTRRYPTILILKPYNSCPQICVYCQRNWEIEEAMAPGAMASKESMEEAISWIEDHPSITEVLITGGDPLVIGDAKLKWILDRVSAIGHIERIRIGSRTLVTLPMRITRDLAKLLGSYRRPGRREICVVTHVQHPYELNLDMVEAVERLRREGISIYNQLVYTFFTSRRFEATLLRRMLRLVGIDPYYSFNTKGKEETADYRVPISRLLQEQKEEARLLSGMARTDEPVYNVPRLGKNNLRAMQHRDLITVMPDGSRIYEFHPWEKNIVRQSAYLSHDVPILNYLQRLASVGEDPDDYGSIWYYF